MKKKKMKIKIKILVEIKDKIKMNLLKILSLIIELAITNPYYHQKIIKNMIKKGMT